MLFLSGICQTSNILKILFSIFVIIKVAFIIVPIVLIVMIIIDILKSTIIKDNIIAKKLNIAMKRIIICLGIFFIPTVIETTINLINKTGINFKFPYEECIENASLSKITEIEKYETALKAKEEIASKNNELNKQLSEDKKNANENTPDKNIDSNNNINSTPNIANTNNDNINDNNTVNTNSKSNSSINNTPDTNNATTITQDTNTNIPNDDVTINSDDSTNNTPDTSTTNNNNNITNITDNTNTINSNNTPDNNTTNSNNSTSQIPPNTNTTTPDSTTPPANNNTNNISNNNTTNITDNPNNNSTNNNTTTNSNNTNQNSKVNVEAFLNSLNKMSTIVEKDYQKGKKWHYSNDHTESTFEKERKRGRETNCAKYVSWALVDIGVLKDGQSIYKAYSNGKNEIKGSGATKIQNSKKVKIINANAKTPKELEKEGKLKPGDIMLWYNVQHTNVYAGDKKFYDAGHTGTNGCTSSNEYFKTLGPVKTSYYNNWKVWKIIRVKG